MGVTAELVHFIHNSRFDDLPEEVVFRTKTLITDAVGTMLAGSVEEGSRILQDYVKQTGGKEEASLVGAGIKASAACAALANAASGHALDFDSIQLSSWPGTAHGIRIHPTTPALAASLAVGEPVGISGRSLILATVVGIEVACRVTEAIPPDSYQVAYQSTATMGGLGAAAAAGKLLELNGDELMRALSLAATMAGGLRENFGTMTKSFHSGRAAEAGVLAARLAKAGFTAAPDILEAKRGFFLAMGGQYEASQITGKLGDPYFLLDPGIHIKRYPCAILTHPAISAVLALVKSHDLRPERIAALKIGVSEVITSTLNHPIPTSGLEGKFSVAFPLALALAERKVGLAQFTDEKVRDPRITEMMRKITVYPDPRLREAGGNEVTANIKLDLIDGRSLERLATLEKGTGQKWIGESELAEKFGECAQTALPVPRAEQALACLLRLEELESIGELTDILGKGKNDG
jgi:2-methylcitrate dehydratase PrpD